MSMSRIRAFGLAILLLTLSSIASAVEPIPLRAGPVTMIFDSENVLLRYIRIGSHEILRGINAPVRNQKWSTVAPKVSNLKVEKGDGGFRVSFDVICAEDDLDFRWKGLITGNANGLIEFTFDGEAHSTFKRNRIGFCVLHPAAAAGQAWIIETVDGKRTIGGFPKYISPHQPAKNLKAITHDVASGIQARVEFEGETFEMEDQRNWTDASFKTYCTPLEIPYPVEVLKGTKIRQKLKISLLGDLPGDQVQAAGTINGRGGSVLTLGERESALPLLGLQVSGEVKNLTGLQLERLKALHLDHLRVDLAISGKSFIEDLRRATREAKALGVKLHIGVSVGDSPAFDQLSEEVMALQPPVAYWLVTDADPSKFAKAYLGFERLLNPSVQLGVSMTTNFVDLNRMRPSSTSIQAVGFAINPQIHAFDNASMVETLPIHADVVNSSRAFGGYPQIIGPITLRPQLVNGKVAPGGPPVDRFPTYVDRRQGTDFTAAWTIGSLKYLADARAQSATYFETVGWNGIMDADDVASRPSGWPSRPGELFPVYELLREIGEFAGGTVRQVDSSDTLAAVGLALHKPGRLRVIVANLSGEPQTVTLRGISSDPGKAHSAASGMVKIGLPAYGIGRIDQASE